jgi:hypothetical protein
MSFRAVLAIVLLASASASMQTRTPAPAASDVWTGTVTVTQRASGTFRPQGAEQGLGFQGDQTTTFTLNGDGTAGFTSTYHGEYLAGDQYTIPTRGSGSGTVYASVDFAGDGWGISIDGDEIPAETDYSSQDAAFMRVFGGMFDALAKLAGQAAPGAPGKRVEAGRVGVSGASVGSRGTENTRTLNGSQSERATAEVLGGPSVIPGTTTVSWNLTRVPRPPSVRIYGPPCGCITGDDPSTTLTFIAGASPRGGEFSTFDVSSSGAMPEIGVNEGGDQPHLDITGTKDTGRVTLRIAYTRNGVRTRSEPITIDFCALDKIQFADDDTDLSFDLDAKLVVDAKMKATRNGQDASQEIEWDLDQMGRPTTLSSEPSSKKGEHIKFTYTGLPEKNADFGPKTLTAKLGGSCPCQQRDTIRTFFPDMDDQHPGEPSPNWFYYWKQTKGVAEARSLLTYQPTIAAEARDGGTPIAKYLPETAQIVISDLVMHGKGCRDEVSWEGHVRTSRPHAQGIDCFSETVTHEMQHYTDALVWWGTPRGHLSAGLGLFEDGDFDQVPLWVEISEPGCKPYSSHSCDNRPFPEVGDAEMNAYWTGWSWPLGSANREDWSCGDFSKQFGGKKCAGIAAR